MGVAELAEALGIHVNTVRFHLDKLAASGQVERVEPARGTPGNRRRRSDSGHTPR